MIIRWQKILMLSTAVALVAACNDMTKPNAPADGAEVAGGPELAVAAASNTWMQRADMPSDRYWPAVAVVHTDGQSVVYAIAGEAGGRGRSSGVNTVQAYNPRTNTWTNRAPLPLNLRNHNGAAVIGGKIYVAGGDTDDFFVFASLFVYDPVRNTWTSKRPMPQPGAGGVSAAINGKLYVLTHCTGDRCETQVSRTLYRYDPATDRWTTLGQAPSLHARGMAGVINGKWYVVGGCCGTGPGQLDVYDPATNRWSTRASMNTKRWQGAGVVSNGKLYVIGGSISGANPDDAVRTTSVYNPATNTWTNLRPMPQPRTGLGGARVVVNGQTRIHVMGGNRPRNHLAYVP